MLPRHMSFFSSYDNKTTIHTLLSSIQGLLTPEKKRASMEFTETFKISQEALPSAANVVAFSPNSRYIATSEYRPPARRIGVSVGEILPSWIVRIYESESMNMTREYVLELPAALFSLSAVKECQQSVTIPNRQFLTGKRTDAPVSSTTAAPTISPQVNLAWSPNGHFLAVWPVDAAVVFIVAPSRAEASPLLRIEEQAAVGIQSIKWTPNSAGLLTILSFGMGVKYWRLDCKQAMHLFPYPKNVADPIDFSADGKFMALLHRRDGADHIAIYQSRQEDSDENSAEGDFSVFHWLSVPEDLNLEGLSFARGMGSLMESEDSIPFLYAWDSTNKFSFVVYGGDGQMKCQIGPEDLLSGMSGEEVDPFDKAFLTFGVRGWKWCQSGRLACFADAQENVYLWNAVIHKLMGQITLQLDALKLQNPIVFREHALRDGDRDRFKYEASYAFPLQSQILMPSGKALEQPLSYALSQDGDFLALHQPAKYPNCLWIFDLRGFKLKAVLLQQKAITDYSWNVRENVLAIATGSDHVYFWQPDGTHCIPYPSNDFAIKAAQWHRNARTMLLIGGNAFCLGIPDILNGGGEVTEPADTSAVY